MTSILEQKAIAQLHTLFLVGGTGRFVGKSTFAEMLIKKFSAGHPIVALKISNIKPGDGAVHGWHGDQLKEPFKIEEELVAGDDKDTRRFLAAGAKRSFFLRSFEESLPQAMEAFFKLIDQDTLLVAESNTLRNHIHPGAFIMVTDASKPVDKKEAINLLDQADRVFTRLDKEEFQEVIAGVSIGDNGWTIERGLL
jgi:hypothetical protein